MTSPGTQQQLDYSSGLGTIENLEQNVIQHIRTSGIRTPRETQLIDEVMELRRERRKLFSTVVNQLRTVDSLNAQLTDDLNNLKEKQAKEATGLQAQLAHLLTQKQNDHENFDQQLRKELEIQEEKFKFMERLNIEKVKKKCEERMKLLELKVNEVLQAKAQADNKDARKIAIELVTKEKEEMEKKCNDKIAQ